MFFLILQNVKEHTTYKLYNVIHFSQHYARKVQGAQVKNYFKTKRKKVQGSLWGAINVSNLQIIHA